MSHVPASLKPASALRRTRSPLSLALLLAVAIAVALVPFVFTLSPYVLNIFMQAATYAIAVLGMTVVLGYTGQINLAQATFFGLGAYAVGSARWCSA